MADQEHGDDGDEDVGGLLPLAPDQHLAASVPAGARPGKMG